MLLSGLPGVSNVVYAQTPEAKVPKLNLVLTPQAIEFGLVGVGSSSSQTVILSNHGIYGVTLVSISTKGSGFSVAGLTGRTIVHPGHTITLTATFKPESSGAQSGSISIATPSQIFTDAIPLSGTGTTSKLSVTPSDVNFGTVSMGSQATQTMKLTNEGNHSAVIRTLTVSGAEFGVTGLSTPQTLTPGQSVTFTAKFDPKTTGRENGEISIGASGGAETIALRGVGIHSSVQLVASATSVAFGNVPVGSSVTRQVTLTNKGNSKADISRVSVNGSSYASSGLTSSTVLDADQSAVLTVTFDPKTSGSLPGAITITSNAPNSPLKINLTGDGTSSGPPISVDLRWEESTSAGVVGYYVYRGPKTSGPFSQLNSEPDAATTFTDSSVVSGQSYVYVVTSVNSSGVQSGYSSPISVNIPAD